MLLLNNQLLPIHAVAALLLGLEFRGVVRALPGKKFALV